MKIVSTFQNWSYQRWRLEDRKIQVSTIRSFCELSFLVLPTVTRQNLYFPKLVWCLYGYLSLSLSRPLYLHSVPSHPEEATTMAANVKAGIKMDATNDELKLTPCAKILRQASPILLKGELWRKLYSTSARVIAGYVNLSVEETIDVLFGLQNHGFIWTQFKIRRTSAMLVRMTEW